MRAAYLRSTKDGGGCRGGVSSADGEEYELEIGADKNASPEMMALCALIDEVVEFIKFSPSPIGQMIYLQYRKQLNELEKQLQKDTEQRLQKIENEKNV